MSEFKFIIATSEGEIKVARQIRKEVFVQEQGIPEELDLDADEERSINLLVYKEGLNNQFIGTGRLTINENEAILSRICILKSHRHSGLGKLLVQELERVASEKGVNKFKLKPHAFLERFYQSLGYQNINENYTVGPYLLLTMAKPA
jgi:predicted GNAT family N-acyltransferase